MDLVAWRQRTHRFLRNHGAYDVFINHGIASCPSRPCAGAGVRGMAAADAAARHERFFGIFPPLLRSILSRQSTGAARPPTQLSTFASAGGIPWP
jgi:hypothetical protein